MYFDPDEFFDIVLRESESQGRSMTQRNAT